MMPVVDSVAVGAHRVREINLVIPAKAGQIHQEWIWATRGRPEGQDAGMYPAIQSVMVCGCLWLDPRLRGDDDGEIVDTIRSDSTHLCNKPGV